MTLITPKALSVLPGLLTVWGVGVGVENLHPPCLFVAHSQVPLNWEVDQMLLCPILPWVSLGLLLLPSAACPVPLSLGLRGKQQPC